MLPYVVVLSIAWTLFFAAWYLLGIPLGAGIARLTYSRPPELRAHVRGEEPEELRLGDHRLLELVEQHPLVGGVDVAVAVGGSEEHDLGVGHGLLQRGDERDRATRRGVHRLGPQAAAIAVRTAV